MYERELLKYRFLNQLAESDGIVIFGGSQDVDIPLGELKQAFALDGNLYNRSFGGLRAADAVNLFRESVAELCPDTLLLHIGDADVFDFDSGTFEKNYRALIHAIRAKHKNCRIVIVSQKNYENNPVVAGMNDLLKTIASAETCDFEDVSAKHSWNPQERSEISTFIHDLGFVRPLNIKRPVYDLVRILFCYEG